MKVVLLTHTPNPEKAIATAARICYSPLAPSEVFDDMSGEKIQRLINTIVSQGHGSALEHASFTFGIEDVSRAMTHQLVRHRLASYNQQSQRYVDERKTFRYVTPWSILNNHDKVADYPVETDVNELFKFTMEDCYAAYQKLVDAGVPKEDARYVLPNAVSSNIIVTMNVRELLHFFELRLCNRAQWEIREVAEEMLRICKEVSPLLFKNAGPQCVLSNCPEGRMSCGNPRVELRD